MPTNFSADASDLGNAVGNFSEILHCRSSTEVQPLNIEKKEKIEGKNQHDKAKICKF